MKKNIPTGITRIVHISTNIGQGCEHCGEFVGAEKFAESVNHYMEKHGYTLLHVGSECDIDAEGKLCHHTIAVLGK